MQPLGQGVQQAQQHTVPAAHLQLQHSKVAPHAGAGPRGEGGKGSGLPGAQLCLLLWQPALRQELIRARPEVLVPVWRAGDGQRSAVVVQCM